MNKFELTVPDLYMIFFCFIPKYHYHNDKCFANNCSKVGRSFFCSKLIHFDKSTNFCLLKNYVALHQSTSDSTHIYQAKLDKNIHVSITVNSWPWTSTAHSFFCVHQFIFTHKRNHIFFLGRGSKSWIRKTIKSFFTKTRFCKKKNFH